MTDVFLSYRNTPERRRIITRLATILRAYGISVWWDYGLDAGESYNDQITAALRDAKVVIPFWCEESVESEWVHKEASLGREKLLPVRLQKVTPPAAFAPIHAAHFEDWTGSILDPRLDEFIRDLCSRLGRSPRLPPDTRAELASLPPIEPLQKPANSKKKRGGVGWAVLASLLITVLVGGGYAAWNAGLFDDLTVDQASTTPVHVTPTNIARLDWPPNDPFLDFQWYLGPYSEGGAGILDYREKTGADGSGVTIAMIGTGVYTDHPEFVGSNSLVAGIDMIRDLKVARDGDGRDTDPTDPGDMCGSAGVLTDTLHGTLSASLISAATDNSEGIAGIAPGAKLVPVRALGACGGKLSDINDGIRWAAGLIPVVTSDQTEVWNQHPADILVLPMGLSQACPSTLQSTINAAYEAGVIIISSAGNQGVSTHFFSPAGCQNVLSIGSTDARGVIAPYSNGDVTLLVPGGDLKRDDNSDSRPDGILGAKYSADCIDIATGTVKESCDYAFEQGSSMSAAIAGGALALLKSQHLDESREELIQRYFAATVPMDARACSGECETYPGASPIPGLAGLCKRGCGRGRLDLSRAD